MAEQFYPVFTLHKTTEDCDDLCKAIELNDEEYQAYLFVMRRFSRSQVRISFPVEK
jgi:hypothetical protein